VAVTVRPARPDDRAGPGLLYVSAQPYYDAFTGSEQRARRLLAALWGRPGHTAAYDRSRVAELDGALTGVMVAFPAAEGDALARRFLGGALVRMPPWGWIRVLRHLRAAAGVMPVPPGDSLYIDALAVSPAARRHGVASALLRDAEATARDLGLRGVSLDTGLENHDGQALYDACGYERRGERRVRDERIAAAIGGPGFISYYKAV
jgi:ribosomal protein S18 acetylase RimI-like enzyme